MDLNLVRLQVYLFSALILSIMIIIGIYSYTIVGLQGHSNKVPKRRLYPFKEYIIINYINKPLNALLVLMVSGALLYLL